MVSFHNLLNISQISILQECLSGLSGAIFLEFNIPRMGRRIDAVLLVGPVVFVVEFKVGVSAFDSAGRDQVWDYALDLKNFHEASHDAPIVPILVATEADQPVEPNLQPDEDNVYHPIPTTSEGLRQILDFVLRSIAGSTIDSKLWGACAVSSDSYHY